MYIYIIGIKIREIWAQSYQRLTELYLITPYYILNIIRYRSRVSGTMQEKE